MSRLRGGIVLPFFVALGAVALVIAVGVAGVAGVAIAGVRATPAPQSMATPTTDRATPAPGSGVGKGHGWGAGGVTGAAGLRGLGAPLVSALADQLGLDEATVREAIRNARDTLKDERLADRESGPPPWSGSPQANSEQFVAAVASALGVSQAELSSALDEIRSEARSARARSFQGRLDRAVADGTLTRDEADAVLKAAREGVIPMRVGPNGDD